jgi:hypothetical protein
MSGGHEIPTIEEIEVAEPADDLPTGGADDDKEARAQLAREADEAWGKGDAAGQAWEAPSASSDAWVPTINPWAPHQSEEIADWLRRKAEDVELLESQSKRKLVSNRTNEQPRQCAIDYRNCSNHCPASRFRVANLRRGL